MPSIPNNNLFERLDRLGYSTRSLKIEAPKIVVEIPPSTTQVPTYHKQPEIVLIDDWSDFDDD